MKKLIFSPLLLAVAFSCINQIDPADRGSTRIQIEDAKRLLSLKSSSLNDRNNNNNISARSIRHSISKKANWENAFYQRLSFGDALIVPVKFDQEIYYKPNKEISLALSSLTYLMFYNDKTNTPHLEVITAIPNFEVSDSVLNQKFKGVVHIEEWSGDYIKGFIYKNGSAYAINQIEGKREKNLGSFAVQTCITTDWYTCVSVGSVSYGCNYDYSETSCTISSDGGGGASSGYTGSADVGSGGVTSSDYNDVADNVDTTPICPANFHFVSVTKSNLWQEAAISDSYSRLVYISPGAFYVNLTIELPILYFGLPYSSVDGKILFSSLEAQAISVDAFNEAEQDLRAYFKLSPYLSEVSYQVYWLKRMQYHMASYTGGLGRVSTTGSINASNPVYPIKYVPCSQ